jgi:hypothetical protein
MGSLHRWSGRFLPIARISGPDDLLEQGAAGLPNGAAQAEAVAVRLRRAGVELLTGEPEELPDAASFVRFCYARGASSVRFMRAVPSSPTRHSGRGFVRSRRPVNGNA